MKQEFKDVFWSMMPDNCSGFKRREHVDWYTFCDVYMENKAGGRTIGFEEMLEHYDVFIAEANRCKRLPVTTSYDGLGRKDFNNGKLGAVVICKENMCTYSYNEYTFGGKTRVYRREITTEKVYNKWLDTHGVYTL